MIEQICITDHKGPRFYTRADFPLSIGPQVNADLETASEDGGSDPAFFIIIVNRAYIDTDNSKVKILLNNERVSGQKEIQHDDILEIEGVAFHCEHIGNTLSISLYDDDSHLITRNEAIASDGELIEPLVVPERVVEKKSNKGFKGFLIVFSLLVFGLFAIVLGYIFTAKTLLIEIEPAPDRIALHGKFWPIKIQERYLVQPGNYYLEVNKDGYRPLQQKIKVSKHQTQTLTFTLEKKPGYLTISSQPVDQVQIHINGERIGNTPIDSIELEPGSYSVEANAERYQLYTTQLVIEGKELAQQLDIELLPDWQEILIDSQPAGAEIWLNNEKKG